MNGTAGNYQRPSSALPGTSQQPAIPLVRWKRLKFPASALAAATLPALPCFCEHGPMPTPNFPAPPLPKSGQQRAWWRQPASRSALAWAAARAAEAHDGPLLLVARDNHAAHQLESDL